MDHERGASDHVQDELEDRVARTLEVTVGITARLDRLNAEVAALTTSLATTLSSSDTLPVDLLALPGRVDDIGAGLTEIRVRLASIDELADRTDRLQELLTAVAREIAARPDAPASADVGPALDELSRRVDEVGRRSPDPQVLDDRLAAIQTALFGGPPAEADGQPSGQPGGQGGGGPGGHPGPGGLLDAVAVERQVTLQVVSAALAESQSRLDGELETQLRSIETLFGVFGDALTAKLAAAFTTDVAERMWADSTRVLEAFSGEAGQAVMATTTGVQQAIDAAEEASRAGTEIATVLRAELVGLRQAIRAAVAGLAGSRPDTEVEALRDANTAAAAAAAEAALAATAASAEHLAGLETATDDLRQSLEGGNETLRSALDGVLASMTETLSAVAGALDRQGGVLTSGMQEAVVGIREAVGSTHEVVAGLLADQLGALDHRQGIIEDGLRALWSRLDRVDESIDTALATPPTLPPDLALELQASIGGGIAEAVTAALAAEEERLAAAHDAIHAAVARAALSPEGMVDAVAQLRDQVTHGIDTLPDHVAAAVASLPDAVATVVRERFSAELSATVLELTGRLDAALARLPAELADTIALPAEVVAGAVAEQLRAQLAAQLGEDLSRSLEPFATAAAALPAQFEPLPDRITDAVSGLPDVVAAAVSDQLAADLTPILDQLPAQLAAAVAGGAEQVSAATNARLDALPDQIAVLLGTLPQQIAAAVAALPDSGEAIAGQVAEAVTERFASRLGLTLDSLPEVLNNVVKGIPEYTAAHVAEAVNAVVAGVGTAAQELPDLVAAKVADAVQDATAQALAAVSAQVAGVSDGIDEHVTRAAEAAVALDHSALDRATAGLDAVASGHEELRALLLDVVDRLDNVETAPAQEPVDLAALNAALSAGMEEAGRRAAVEVRAYATDIADAAAKAASKAVAKAAGKAVADTLAEVPAPDTPVDMPEIATGMVVAVAASLQEFGGQVQRDLDAIGDHLETLSEVLDRAVSVLSEMGTRRREGPTEALGLLRQVADEAASGIRNDNRRRRGLPTGPSTRPATGT